MDEGVGDEQNTVQIRPRSSRHSRRVSRTPTDTLTHAMPGGLVW